MSDNVANINNFTGCPYCCGSYSTAGFIHEINCPAMQGRQAIPGGSPIKKQAGDATTRGDTICPICGDAYFRCDHYPNVLISEIYRLKAALEKAETEINRLKSEMLYHETTRQYLIKQRDEGRRCAFILLELAEYWKKMAKSGFMHGKRNAL